LVDSADRHPLEEALWVARVFRPYYLLEGDEYLCVGLVVYLNIGSRHFFLQPVAEVASEVWVLLLVDWHTLESSWLGVSPLSLRLDELCRSLLCPLSVDSEYV
jgi:hypothetical protein